MPAFRTRDTQQQGLEATTEGPPPPALSILSPTPRAFSFPIGTPTSDSPCASWTRSPFDPNPQSLSTSSCIPLLSESIPTLESLSKPTAPTWLVQRCKRLESLYSTVKPDHRPSKGDEDYIERPPNAFILFRRHCCEERQAATDEAISDRSRKERLADLSKTISSRWKSLSSEERQYWDNKAKEGKKKHEEMYPNYRYRPRSKREKPRLEKEARKKHMEMYPNYVYQPQSKEEKAILKKDKRADVEESNFRRDEFLLRFYGVKEPFSCLSSKSLHGLEPPNDNENPPSPSEKHYPAPYEPQASDRNLTRRARRQASRQARKQRSERTKQQSPRSMLPSISFLRSLFQAKSETAHDKTEEDEKNLDGNSSCTTDDLGSPDPESQDSNTSTSCDASDETLSSTIIHDGNFTNVNGNSYNTYNIHITMDPSVLSSLAEDEALEEEDNTVEPLLMEEFGSEYEHPEIIYQTPHPPPTRDIPPPLTTNIPPPHQSSPSWFLPIAFNPCYFWPPPILCTGWSFVIAGWVMMPPISWSWPFYSWA